MADKKHHPATTTVDGIEDLFNDIVNAAINGLPGAACWLRYQGPQVAAAVLVAFPLAFRVHPAITAGAVVGAVALVSAVEHRWLRRWRRARMLRWRWERCELGRGSKLRRIRILDGAATATVTLRDGNWTGLQDKLDVHKGQMLRRLGLGRGWGTPNLATFTAANRGFNAATKRKIKLNYRPLPNPWSLQPYEEPAVGLSVFFGDTVDGPLMVDLSKAPHAEVVGGTGSGKGVFLKCVEGQLLRGGWLGVTIDGGDSPEHGPLERAPTWLCPGSDPWMSEAAKLREDIVALDVVADQISLRSEVCRLFDVDQVKDLPGPVRQWLRPVAVIADEITALLATEKDKELDDLRAQLRHRLDTQILRRGRKFDVFGLPFSDQFAYSGVFSKAAAMQAESRMILGNLAPEHVKQATGLASLPSVDEPNLAGHYVKFGQQDSVVAVVLRPNTRESLKRAVAYARGES